MIAIVQLLVVSDNTVLNVALSAAARDLGIGDGQRQWMITAYALALGSLLLLGGRLADLLGRKRALVVGLTGLTVTSVIGGAAVGGGMLLVARAGQGASAALVAPACLALLTEAFGDGRGRAFALGVFSAVVASGATLGVLLGGLLAEYLGWRWCLYAGAVVALVGLAGSVVVRDTDARSRPHVDVLGAVTVSAGLFGVTLGLADAGSRGWSSPLVLVPLLTGAVLLVGFVVLQRRGRTPLLPLRVVADRNRGGSYLAMFVAASGMFTTALFTTDFLQRALRFSPVPTGLAFLPMAVVIVGVATTVPVTLLPRWGPRPLVAGGLVLGAAALFWLSRLDGASTYPSGVLGPLLLMGVAVGTTNAAAVNTATRGVAPDDAGVASAVLNTVPQLGGALAIAVLSSVAGATTLSALGGVPSTPEQQLVAAVAGDGAAFRTAAVVFLVGAVVCGSLIRLAQPDDDRANADQAGHGAERAR